MKRNFYLQHPLMAMHDPRMQYLLKMEKLKGTGAYWFVIEKLAMLPGSCVDMEFLRPYCKMHKISFAYVKKIILGYELFDFEEDGSFAPAELNPNRFKSGRKQLRIKRENRKIRFEKRFRKRPEMYRNRRFPGQKMTKNDKKRRGKRRKNAPKNQIKR